MSVMYTMSSSSCDGAYWLHHEAVPTQVLNSKKTCKIGDSQKQRRTRSADLLKGLGNVIPQVFYILNATAVANQVILDPIRRPLFWALVPI